MTLTIEATLASEALQLHDRGISIIPLLPGRKKPVGAWEQYQVQRPTRQQVAGWWRSDPNRNIGIVTGTVSGLVAVDIDDPAIYDRLPVLEIVGTARAKTSRGVHIYYRYPPEGGVGIWKGDVPGLGHIEVHGDGAYMLVPPSRHPSGATYRWIAPLTSVDSLPVFPPGLLVGSVDPPPRCRVDAPDKPADPIGATAGDAGGSLSSEELSRLLAGVAEGERNDAATRLAGHYLGLGLPKAEVHRVLELWNTEKNRPPLPKKEIRQVIGSVAKAEGRNHPARMFCSGKTVIPARVADHLRREHRFAVIGGQLMRFDGTKYGPADEFVRREVRGLLGDLRRSNHVEEVLHDLTDLAPHMEPYLGEDIIPLANGWLQWETGRLLRPDPDVPVVYNIPHEWNPAAQSKEIESFLTDVLGSEELVNLMVEWAGYLLVPSVRFQKMLVLAGPPATGKSTTISVLEHLVGRDNATSISLHDLSEDRFASSGLFGKLLCTFADLPARALRDVGMVKAITGGDTIRGQEKYGRAFSFRPFARLAFSTNRMPDASDASGAFLRRLILVPYSRSFLPEAAGQDHADAFKDKILLTEPELQGLLRTAVDGLTRLWSRGRFQVPDESLAALDAYRSRGNSAAEFVEEQCVQGVGLKIGKADLYTAYLMWCERIGKEPGEVLGQGRFNAQMEDLGARVVRPDGRRRLWTGLSLRAVEEGTNEEIGQLLPLC